MSAVRVGIADSGINPRHPQIGEVAGGVGVHVRDGAVVTDDDWLDQLGHGTAVAATVRGHAPDAQLYSIRIFRRRLEAHLPALLYSIEWAVAHELDVLNLSLGCDARELRDACASATAAGLIVVATRADELPGSIAVGEDRELDTGELRWADGVFFAPPWAWPLGELPKERNFHGTSLAVANVTGIVAHALGTGVEESALDAALRERCEKIER